MNRLVVLVGAHSSGKTTLGKALAEHLGWRFDDEIGYQLRLKALQEDPSQLADVNQSDFDRRVCFAECVRDTKRADNAVVETWHGGNLSYIRERSPDIYPEMRQRILHHLSQRPMQVIVVPLQISLKTLNQRQHEVVSDIRFFHRVGERARRECELMNLSTVEPVITDDNRSIESCLEEIIQKITINDCWVTI